VSSPSFGTPQLTRFAILIAVYFAVVLLIPRPESVKPGGIELLGVFLATIAGLILQPIPGGAIVLIALTVVTAIGAMPITRALAGYSDTSVWLVVAAFIISRALLNTGLARRIALFFVRAFGKSSLGVCYALGFSDVVLATIIPSNGARSGGVVLPIVRSISELYGSKPGPTANLLGAFLMVGVYQSICISAAMFYTGQASNPLAAAIATKAGFDLTPKVWLLAGLVPGLCSMFLVPLVVQRMMPPGIRKTPEARQFAHEQLVEMGRLSSAERIVSVVFVCVCLGWVTARWLHNLDITVVALLGCCFLLISGVITWEDVKRESALWDIFIWYGGMVLLGRELNEKGITEAFAKAVADTFSFAGWVTLFVIALLIYFYAHYAFASITAHILAMYPPFLAVLVAKGAPIGLVAMSFAAFVNLAAGLTNYGTTPSPMYFAHEYVSMKDWWRVGFVVSVVNLTIWSTIGFAWWKLIGVW